MQAEQHCQNCGAVLSPNKKFCTSCGTPVPSAAVRAPAVAQSSPAQPPGQETSLQRSLARLGIPVSLNSLIGFFAALVVGLIVPRLLPYIFPIFYPVLNFFFRGSPDTFNRFMMTILTFLSSFIVSFVVASLPRLRKQR